jgi:hypothetical protein
MFTPKCQLSQENKLPLDMIMYAHSAAVTAWTPIYVAGIGVLIAVVSALINTSTQYIKSGRFIFDIQTAETVAQFAVVYYDTATDKVTTTSSATTFLLGFAVEAGTGTAGTVIVELLPHPLSAQISQENLDSGILPSHIVKYAGTFAAGGTQTTETKVIASALSTDIVVMQVKTLGGDATAYIRSSTAADGSISCLLNTPMGTGSPVIKYVGFRAVV